MVCLLMIHCGDDSDSLSIRKKQWSASFASSGSGWGDGVTNSGIQLQSNLRRLTSARFAKALPKMARCTLRTALAPGSGAGCRLGRQI